jgi:hypothetical protein
MRLAAIVDGDEPVATMFPTGDTWGVAARGTDREDFGGPAVIPTMPQLLLLADLAGKTLRQQAEGQSSTAFNGSEIGVTTYPKAMDGILHSGWESRAAAERRRLERHTAILREVVLVPCETCQASDGGKCRTRTGRLSEEPHRGRLREATAIVDARLGWLGDNPVHVDAD